MKAPKFFSVYEYSYNQQFIKGLLVFISLLSLTINAQTPDFKVQHIQDEVARTGGSNTTFTPVSSLSNTIELANNNRKTHGGPVTNSGNRPGDDMSGARQLTDASTLSYYRESGSDNRDMRFNTSLWEYIGPAGSENELIVRGRYAIVLNGGTNSITQALTGITNANNCIPFITGILNNSSSQDADSATAVAYLEDTTTLRIQKGSNANNVTVYITLVEFTGTNWTVLHGDSGNTNADTGTITLRDGSDGTGTATNVSNWTEAAIFGHFRADTGSSGSNDAISDLWPLIEPGSNNQRVDWTFDSGHDSAGTNRHFVHVLVNSGLNVTRFQNNSNNSGERTIDITSAGLSDVNQALIVGSAISSGNGTAYGRGWRNYYLKSATEAAHWCHRSGNTLSHEIQIIDLSGLQTNYTGPEINVQGNGTNIPDGNTAISLLDDTDFGELETTGAISVSHTFTIQNLGSANVTLNDPSPYITITGSTADFTLVANPTTPITAGGNTTFTITYDPTTSGTHVATVSIANNDTDEDPYTFLIQGKGEYCDSNGSLDYDTSITYVSFNTISNADNEIPKDNAYEDFTNIYTNVYKNSTHNLSINVNTDGNYEVFTIAWIDWNRDGDFDDAGEEYQMGSATNVVDGPTSLSPLAITIPSTAIIGSTTMRVATKWQEYPSSCDSGFDGEVEDYTINVIDYLIDFDGIDEHIDIQDNHDLTGSFSLEAWVLQEASVATGTIISKGNIDLSLKTGYHFSLKNNYPSLIWYDNSNNEVLNITSPYAIPNSEWHHMSATYDGTNARLYIDGIEVISASPSSAPIDTSDTFIIGSDIANSATTPLNINFFDGAIQEVRIWDVALSETQIREMMNQHLVQNSTNVRGEKSKCDISGGLSWSSLLGYYHLSSNTAFDNSGFSINGIPHNIDSSQNASAPVPYESDGDGDWDASATWLNGDDIYLPNSIGVDGSTSIDWNIVELTNDINSGNRDITLNGLVSIVGRLTLANPTEPLDETNSGHSLTVTGYLEIDGIIDLVGESQLIQTEGSIIDADSGGYIERDQQGTANSFNYNYWSSSVGAITGDIDTRGIGLPYSNANQNLIDILFDGTDSSAYQNITFNPSAYAGDSGPTSPIVKSTYWLFKFYGPADNYYSWQSIDELSDILPGEGFTMKGSSGAADILNDFQNYVFEGLPNNGIINVSLNKNMTAENPSGNVDRLIGNPYPSAIDATEFILDNLSLADGGTNINGTIFNGAIYFWDHFGIANTHILGDYIGGYATRNLLAGAPAIANDTRINATGGSGTKIPGQYVPVNQGFFVTTSLNGFDNDNGVPIAVVDGGDVVFKNSQRVFVRESAPNSLFMRTSETSNNQDEEQLNNSLIRLTFDSPSGLHRQIVLGSDDKASIGFDIGYDAFMADVNQEDMYWLFEQERFVIQGVDSFNEGQEFPIGLKIKESGIARIQLEDLQNIDDDIQIYIRDTDSGEQFEITTEPFEVHLESGTYNDRFSLVFESRLIEEEDIITEESSIGEEDIIVHYNSSSSELTIRVGTNVLILGVTLNNALGQKIQSLNYSTTDTNTLRLNSGVYILYIETAEGIITKKIIID